MDFPFVGVKLAGHKKGVGKILRIMEDFFTRFHCRSYYL